MAVQMGLEPTISSVTGRHVNHYTTGPIFNLNGADYKYLISIDIWCYLHYYPRVLASLCCFVPQNVPHCITQEK